MARTDDLFVVLSDARPRNIGHEAPSLGNPPFGDFVRKERSELVNVNVGSGVDDDKRQRPFLPFIVRDADYRASYTAGWPISVFSSSTEEIHSPPDLMTSFERSVSVR